MADSLGTAKFYGHSLPRPRIYADVKFRAGKMDPPVPVPVTDPLMSWADEAHWSRGGHGFNSLRLQGKIEGNVNKLRAERENRSPDAEAHSCFSGPESNRAASLSTPPAPVVTKRRRYMAFTDDDEEEGARGEEIEAGNRTVQRRLVKKLRDDFDRVASENERSDGSAETGNEEKFGRLEGRYDDDDAVMGVVEEVDKSNHQGKKAKAGKYS